MNLSSDRLVASQGKMDPEQRQSLVAQGKALKDSLADIEQEMDSLQESLQREGQLLPNLAHPTVSMHAVHLHLSLPTADPSYPACALTMHVN